MKKDFTRFLLVGGVAVAVSLTPSLVSAQSSPNMDAGSQKMMKSPDAKFAMMAAQGGMAEVQMGQLAAQKATNPDVKAFGQKMVDDHTQANDKLKSVASEEGMTLPTSINGKMQAEYSRLQNLSGSAFDQAYVKMMVKDHEEDVKEFQKEANSGSDPKIKSFASETLPTLQGHLNSIKAIQSQMSGGGSSNK
jgi:putative membrane protein